MPVSAKPRCRPKHKHALAAPDSCFRQPGHKQTPFQVFTDWASI